MNNPKESSASLRSSTISGQSKTGRSPKTRIALFDTFRWLTLGFQSICEQALRFEARAALRRGDWSTAKEMMWAVQHLKAATEKSSNGGAKARDEL